MLSCCGAFKRSNNPYTESIVKPCVSKNQKVSDSKISSLFGFDLEENAEKALKQWKKVTMNWKRNLCTCARKKNNSFEITVIIFKLYKNANLLFKKDFKIAELLTKISFLFYFRGCPQNVKEKKTNKTSEVYVQE